MRGITILFAGLTLYTVFTCIKVMVIKETIPVPTPAPTPAPTPTPTPVTTIETLWGYLFDKHVY
jgi:hypothetical protein